MSWQRGDVVGGPDGIDMADRCYYWRDADGAWHPFPDNESDRNEQMLRTDEDMDQFVESGRLIRYPVSEFS